MRISFFLASFFLAVLINYNASNALAQGKLEIMIVPTARPLNYKTPTRLAYGAMGTYSQKFVANKIKGLERTAIGHGLVRVLCNTGEEEVDFWSGFDGDINHESLKLALSGAGLSLLFYNYCDGYIQNTESVLQYLNDISMQTKIEPSFLRINVNQDQCRLIKQHYDEFNQQDTLWYGFFTDVEGANGAGCTSYIVSFAQKVDAFPPFLETSWTRNLDVSIDLLGPTDQADEIDGYPLWPVSFFKFLNPIIPVKWNKKRDYVVPLSFLDPQLMVNFMRTSISCLEDPDECKDQPDLINWLIESNAKITTNEYMRGIEISLE